MCTTTQATVKPVPLPMVLQKLIAQYYVAEEPRYEELEKEPTELEAALADLKKGAV